MGSRFWDFIAGFYDLAQSANKKGDAEAVRRVSALVPEGACVLDCAAGTGEFSLAAAVRAETVLCTDLSQPMLDRAACKAGQRGLSNLSFAIRDLTALPDPDGAFDIVIAANVLHLLPEPERAVTELLRVTARGGKLILPTFLQGEAGPGFKILLAFYKLLGFRPKYLFTLESYRAMLEGCAPAEMDISLIPGRLPQGLAVLTKE